jgi:hypothetical protein
MSREVQAGTMEFTVKQYEPWRLLPSFAVGARLASLMDSQSSWHFDKERHQAQENTDTRKALALEKC